MKPARIILLAVALLAGGLAAFFAMSGSSPDPVQTAAPVAQQTKVLVASRTIGLGERLNADSVSWQEWPANAIRPEFITNERLPDAPSQLEGVVARFEIFVGEPVREAKLVRAEQGYLSAVIGQGMRGVSIRVSPESGAGGFISPNDRVDVILTQSTDLGESSQTILSNARVLAIGPRLGEVGASAQADGDEEKRFSADTIATMELTPAQAETIVNAQEIGTLSLVLRSVVDFATGPASDAIGNNSTIQLIRAGKSTSARSSIAPVNNAAQTETAGTAQAPIFQEASSNTPTSANSGTPSANSGASSGGVVAPVLQ